MRKSKVDKGYETELAEDMAKDGDITFRYHADDKKEKKNCAYA